MNSAGGKGEDRGGVGRHFARGRQAPLQEFGGEERFADHTIVPERSSESLSTREGVLDDTSSEGRLLARLLDRAENSAGAVDHLRQRAFWSGGTMLGRESPSNCPPVGNSI